MGLSKNYVVLCRAFVFGVSQCEKPLRFEFKWPDREGKLGKKGGCQVELACGKDASVPSVGSILDLLRA